MQEKSGNMDCFFFSTIKSMMGDEANFASMPFAPATHKQIRDAPHLSFALLAVRLPRHSIMLA